MPESAGTLFYGAAIMVAIVLLFLVFMVGCVYLGYWMGRNSIERPLRSQPKGPGKTPRRKPTPEPAGDVFNDAAYGTGEDSGGKVSTLRPPRG